MKEVILGIGGYLGHDANAALLVDGQLISASQEERFTRRKHDGFFPYCAIADCLATAGLTHNDVTDVVLAEKSFQSKFFDQTARPGGRLVRAVGRLLHELPLQDYEWRSWRWLRHARRHFAWHHLSHVAGAFHTSRFDRAAFLCVDGKGEDYSASAGIIDHEEIKLLWEQPYDNGLGMFYTLTTLYLGFFSFGSEYKVMGLAPYGTPRFVDRLSQLFTTDERGGFRMKAPVRFAGDALRLRAPVIAQATGIPPRQPDDPLTQDHIDIATSLQAIFEAETFKMAAFVRAQTGEENFLFCGGCAQNCVTAGKLRQKLIFSSVFNSPVGGDMGSGLGAAFLCARERSPKRRLNVNVRGFYLGPEPGSIPAEAEPWRVHFEGDLHTFVAAQIAAGKVVGWVRGRMELGARALGARSILADPRQPGIQSTLNLKVKFRESFRPFAPAVLAEDCADWFDTDERSDFMQYTANLVPSRRIAQPAAFASLRERLDFGRCTIPSVVHVDYSARIQTVNSDTHPDFHRLIRAFKEITGVPILINTSFNVSGQPIVRSAEDGWECFLNTDIDLLVLNDRIYRNPLEKTREQKLTWLKQYATSA